MAPAARVPFQHLHEQDVQAALAVLLALLPQGPVGDTHHLGLRDIDRPKGEVLHRRGVLEHLQALVGLQQVLHRRVLVGVLLAEPGSPHRVRPAVLAVAHLAVQDP